MPFGLSTAPHIFTKTLKPIVKYWRFNGINLGLFLDDGWLIESDQDTCSILSKNIKSGLDESGLISSDPKCQWEPCQIIEWLGLVWDSIDGTIKLTDRCIQSIIDAIDNVSKKKYWVSACILASLVGKIVSGGPVFGNLSRIMTRYCSISVASAADWDSAFPLHQYCKRELGFWKANIEKQN